MVSTSTLTHYSERLRPLVSVHGLLLLLIATLFYLSFSDTFSQLLHYWVEGYNWQFLIPIALIYMLWERRDIFYHLEYRPNVLLGSLFLAGSGLLLIAGQVSSTHALRELAIIGTVFSLSLGLLGISATRAMFWPIAYLVLMTSLPTEALDQLRDPLKLVSATISAEILQFFGYAIYREGTFLYLPHITLEVADECSGVNQLTSSIALGVPIAFTILNSWWKRVFIILVSVAFGISMNWLRVVLISLWHYDSAKEEIHGPQDIYGLPFIFMVGVFLTLMIAFALAEKMPSVGRKEGQDDRPNPLSVWFGTKGFIASSLSAVTLLGAVAVYLMTWQAKPVQLSAPLERFPMTVGEFRGQTVDAMEPPFYSGFADDELIASYRNAAGERARAYLGYFRSQDQEKELIDYRYNWLHEDAETVSVDLDGKALLLKKALVTRKQATHTVFFRYDINGRNVVDLKMAKLVSLADALLRQRNNGGIVMVIFDGQREQLSPAEQRFLHEVMSEAAKLLPE